MVTSHTPRKIWDTEHRTTEESLLKGAFRGHLLQSPVCTRSEPCHVDTAPALSSLWKKLMSRSLIVVLRLWLNTQGEVTELTLGQGFVILHTPSFPAARLLSRTNLLYPKAKCILTHSNSSRHCVTCRDALMNCRRHRECWNICEQSESSCILKARLWAIPTRHKSHCTAAALLNVPKHTLHMWVLQPPGSWEPKPRQHLPAPPCPHTTSALQVCTAPAEPQHWCGAENRPGLLFLRNNVP